MYFINLAQLEHSLQERNLGPLKRWKSWVSKKNAKNFQSKLTLAKTFLTLVILEKEKLNIGNCITSLCRSRCVGTKYIRRRRRFNARKIQNNKLYRMVGR